MIYPIKEKLMIGLTADFKLLHIIKLYFYLYKSEAFRRYNFIVRQKDGIDMKKILNI